jgi:MFS transporter, DHA2 family, multidrug resistance protein
VAHGVAPSAVPQTATGWIYHSLLQQAGILAYIDLFAVSAIMCLAMVPLIFLLAPSRRAAPSAKAPEPAAASVLSALH